MAPPPSPPSQPFSPFITPVAPSPSSSTLTITSIPPVSTTSPARPPTPDHQAPDHQARILLVEDQPVNQKLTRLMLNRLGYSQVDLAENGQEAVDLVDKRDYDLILMDLQMPVMGGQDATREIRNNRKLKHQPVIVAVTGYALTGVRESCYESGMNEFLTKPVSLDTLRETLTRTLVADSRA
jgi:CheY-like chemotaxis protein